MQTSPPFEHWALQWATSAQGVPEGRLASGFLVDLLVATSPVHQANSVCFPLNLAAHALGVAPAQLSSALQSLAQAGLLTWHADGEPAAPDVTVTLRFRSWGTGTFEEQDTERMAAAGAAAPLPARLPGSTRAAT
ncbi:hypothetical protein [Streptomyces sp. NPDC093094]|uniref:hypothetical protein n=1 Tax=Streptomyces sp. NPDC093094 TaxID=3366026 RepID=UPI003800365A